MEKNVIFWLNGEYFDAIMDSDGFCQLDYNSSFLDYILMCCGV